MTKSIDFDKFAAEFAKDNTTEIFSQLSVQQYKHGTEFAEDLMITFLASFIASSVYTVMSDRLKHETEETQADKYKMTTEALAKIKTRVQNAVATGFQSSMESFTGAKIEYYCTVQPVPEPPTKLVC